MAKNQPLSPAQAQPSCRDLSKLLCVSLHPIGVDKTNLSHGGRFTEFTNSFRRKPLLDGVSPWMGTKKKVTPGELFCGLWAKTWPAPMLSSFCCWHQWGEDLIFCTKHKQTRMQNWEQSCFLVIVHLFEVSGM